MKARSPHAQCAVVLHRRCARCCTPASFCPYVALATTASAAAETTTAGAGAGQGKTTTTTSDAAEVGHGEFLASTTSSIDTTIPAVSNWIPANVPRSNGANDSRTDYSRIDAKGQASPSQTCFKDRATHTPGPDSSQLYSKGQTLPGQPCFDGLLMHNPSLDSSSAKDYTPCTSVSMAMVGTGQCAATPCTATVCTTD